MSWLIPLVYALVALITGRITYSWTIDSHLEDLEKYEIEYKNYHKSTYDEHGRLRERPKKPVITEADKVLGVLMSILWPLTLWGVFVGGLMYGVKKLIMRETRGQKKRRLAEEAKKAEAEAKKLMKELDLPDGTEPLPAISAKKDKTPRTVTFTEGDIAGANFEYQTLAQQDFEAELERQKIDTLAEQVRLMNEIDNLNLSKLKDVQKSIDDELKASIKSVLKPMPTYESTYTYSKTYEDPFGMEAHSNHDDI